MPVLMFGCVISSSFLHGEATKVTVRIAFLCQDGLYMIHAVTTRTTHGACKQSTSGENRRESMCKRVPTLHICEVGYQMEARPSSCRSLDDSCRWPARQGLVGETHLNGLLGGYHGARRLFKTLSRFRFPKHFLAQPRAWCLCLGRLCSRQMSLECEATKTCHMTCPPTATASRLQIAADVAAFKLIFARCAKWCAKQAC